MTTQEKIAVMQAFVEGRTIQFRDRKTDEWVDYNIAYGSELVWDWKLFTYRIKHELPKTWEEFCKICPQIMKDEVCIGGGSCLSYYNEDDIRHPIYDRRVLPNKNVAEAMLALCQLIQLRNYYNDGWQPDWNDGTNKYVIVGLNNHIHKTTQYCYSSVLAFRTEELRNEFFNNFKELIETAKELL